MKNKVKYVTVYLELPTLILSQIKELATKKGVYYKTLMIRFLKESLDQEFMNKKSVNPV